MTDPAPLIQSIDVAVCDPDLMWRVERMNAVRGVNVRDFGSVTDALDEATGGHPMVVVIGPTALDEEVAALAARGPRSDDIRLLVVGQVEDARTAAEAADVVIDQVISPRLELEVFGAAVLDLLPRADGLGAADEDAGSGATTTTGLRKSLLYEHVIVPFDGTAPAQDGAAVGAEIARRIGAELIVMTASDPDDAEAARQLKSRAQAMSDEGVTVWVEPMANEAKAVATMVGYRPQSLVCMASTARTGVRRAVYGSMAERLLPLVDAPLLLIGPRWNRRSLADVHHLIVCIDAMPTAEAAIPLAASWAEHLQLDATLLHVQTAVDAVPVDLDRLAGPLEARCKVVQKLTVTNADVVGGILDVVRNAGNPLVVMATHARTGLDRLLNGSVMATLISKCEVPVLVQRGPLPVVHVDR